MTQRRILALMFELRARNGSTESLIAWVDRLGDGKYLKHTHPDRSLLDAKAGDRVVFRGQDVFTVLKVKPWRTTECKDETQYHWVTCGRDWEEGAGADAATRSCHER